MQQRPASVFSFLLMDILNYLFIHNFLNHTMAEDDGDRERGDGEDKGDGGDWENSRINVETASLYLVFRRRSYDERQFCLIISHVFLHSWCADEGLVLLPPRLLGPGLLHGLELLRGLLSFLNTGVPSS